MSTASYEVQRAIYSTLSTDNALLALVTGVYDDVPENTRYPYVSIGEDTETNKPSTFLAPGRESTITIHIWSRADGFGEAKLIAETIITRLENTPLVLYRWQWTDTLYEFGQYMRDPDGITRHGVLRFRVRSHRAGA